MKIKRMGWVHDTPDQRDYVFSADRNILSKLPESVDLRIYCPPVYDQLCLGSCVANTVGAAIEYNQIKQRKAREFMPSRQFVYYNTRAIERSIQSDSGCQIRNAIKSVVTQGVCPETEWPYILGTCDIEIDEMGNLTVDTGAHFKQKPSAKCYTDAMKFQTLKYYNLPKSINQITGCLAAGSPIVFGFTVYESFENIGEDGIMPSPAYNEEQLGGHAILAVGYNNKNRTIICRNSWGEEWGDKGHFYMPYSFLISPNCSSFWTITLVEI